MADPFDLRTSKMNKKGQVVSETPYTLYIEGGVRIYERGGEFFYENGDKVPDSKRPAAAPAKKEDPVKSLRETREAVKQLNKKAKDHAEDKAGKDTPEELTESEDEALKSLLGED